MTDPFASQSGRSQEITTTRDCEAILIPVGTPILLAEGSTVFVVQSLGGSHTISVNGNLLRVAAKDADALGMAPEPTASSAEPGAAKTLTGDGTVDEDQVWEQLKTCYDPEIPINIVELGLIYKCVITPEEQGNRVEIVMTLTAPGCGMGEFLAEDVRHKVMQVDNVSSAEVSLSFDPPWSQDMMSEAARLATGMY